MEKELLKAELRGAGKILDLLWINSYYLIGEKASKMIEQEMIYYFGKNWAKKMYSFIEVPNSGHLITPILTLKELSKKI